MKKISIGLMLLTAIPATAAAPLRVKLEVPAVVLDTTPVRARVTIEAAETIAARSMDENRTVTLRIHQVREDEGRRCVSEETFIPSAPSARVPLMVLPAGERAAREIDALADYPLGLPPGEYELVAVYSSPAAEGATWHGTIASDPVRMQVRRPSANPEYAEFDGTCAALVRGDRRAASAALQFAQHYPAFAFNEGLLSLAAHRSEGTVRHDIDTVLQRSFAGSPAAADAALDDASMSRRAVALAAAEQHRAAIAQELQLHGDSEDARAFRRIGTITDAASYARYAAFVEHYPHSAFAADVLYGMLVAVEEGVVRGEASPLRSRLSAEYPHSYRAQQLGERAQRVR